MRLQPALHIYLQIYTWSFNFLHRKDSAILLLWGRNYYGAVSLHISSFLPFHPYLEQRQVSVNPKTQTSTKQPFNKGENKRMFYSSFLLGQCSCNHCILSFPIEIIIYPYLWGKGLEKECETYLPALTAIIFAVWGRGQSTTEGSRG